jgi:hypothetical protein
MLGLNWGGGVHPWASAQVIASIVVGFLALVAFVLWESFKKLKEPLMPMDLFTNRGWNAATIVSGVGASMFYAFAVVWPRMVSELYTNPNDLMAAAVSNLPVQIARNTLLTSYSNVLAALQHPKHRHHRRRNHQRRPRPPHRPRKVPNHYRLRQWRRPLRCHGLLHPRNPHPRGHP